MGVAGCCVGSRPNLFLHLMRCAEYLSSGEKRAADTHAQINAHMSTELLLASYNCVLVSMEPQVGVIPGCAETVAVPSGAVFYSRSKARQRQEMASHSTKRTTNDREQVFLHTLTHTKSV